MKVIIKELKWDAFLTGVLYVLLGLAAMIVPETMETMLGYMIAIVLILAGAVSMIAYLLRDAHQNYYHNDFFHGLVEIGAGIIALMNVQLLIGLIPFLMGALVLISGLSKLQDVIDLKRLEYGNWIVMLAVAAVNVIFGVFLMMNTGMVANVLFRLLGGCLILCGAVDCVNAVYFARKLKKYKQSIQDLEAVETVFTEIVPVDNEK